MHHPALIYRQLMLWLWLAWVLYWVVSAFSAKTTQRRESLGSRLSHVVPLLIGVALIVWPRVPWDWLSLRLLPPGPLEFALGVVLLAPGLAFTVWARVYLGRNWSGMVTLKQGHELIRSGPYAYVRHPIYTGLLIALLGSALQYGLVRSFLAVLTCAVGLYLKVAAEEEFMVQRFGEAYLRYRRNVNALVPFLF